MATDAIEEFSDCAGPSSLTPTELEESSGDERRSASPAHAALQHSPVLSERLAVAAAAIIGSEGHKVRAERHTIGCPDACIDYGVTRRSAAAESAVAFCIASCLPFKASLRKCSAAVTGIAWQSAGQCRRGC